MLKICIVDDSVLFSNTLHKILNTAFPDAQIKVFQDGAGLLTEVESQMPDLILMDINLPDIDGLALTRKIRNENDTIAIIVTTSYNDPEYGASAMEAGADGFISKKKITVEEIINLTRSLIDNSHP